MVAFMELDERSSKTEMRRSVLEARVYWTTAAAEAMIWVCRNDRCDRRYEIKLIDTNTTRKLRSKRWGQRGTLFCGFRRYMQYL
jgi:hypothetical protein